MLRQGAACRGAPLSRWRGQGEYSAGTKSGSSARSLVLLTMLAPVVENRTVRESASSTTKRARKSPTEVPPAAVASFQRQRGPADPRDAMGSAPSAGGGGGVCVGGGGGGPF
jgi:hypothetical protein